MKIECTNCRQAYNIPDERLPAGKKVAFPCPACKSSITIDLRSEDKKKSPKPLQAGAKPDSKTLKNTILKSIQNLPPMPGVVMKAQSIMADPNSSFKELGKIIEADQAIAARVLKLANSAFYGLRGMVSSIHQASVVLGYEALGELITVVGAAGLLDNELEGYGMESGVMWQHSLAVGFGSRAVAIKRYPKLENDAFFAGLLHDAGKIVLDEYVYENKEAFEDVMQDENKTYLAAEKEVFGFDHAKIAHEICMKWSIPEAQGLAIKYHHKPSLSQGSKLAHIIHVADIIAMKGGIGTGPDSILYEIEDNTLDELKLNEEDMDAIMTDVIDFVDKISEEIQGQ